MVLSETDIKRIASVAKSAASQLESEASAHRTSPEESDIRYQSVVQVGWRRGGDSPGLTGPLLPATPVLKK